MKKAFWRQDWFIGLLLSILFIGIVNLALVLGDKRTRENQTLTENQPLSLIETLTRAAPEWRFLFENFAVLIIACYLIMLLPRLSIAAAGIISMVLISLLLISQYIFTSYLSIWVSVLLPCLLITCGYLAVIPTRLARNKSNDSLTQAQRISGENRDHALIYLEQEQLDLAFEKFRQCQLNNEIMENLYKLALEFEKKGSIDKAHSVYEYMAEYDAEFRDIKEKIKRNKNLQETMVYGATSTGHVESVLPLEDDGNVMIGRYNIDKELGKGAMGTVYLGADPKINRTVAVKTLPLSEEFDEDEIDEVKERFFREAETAGRLTHPNIVTIYDVGEEHGLAYIAMEFLDGHDLIRYTKPNRLLPLTNVLQIIILAAGALDYAHAQNVVHRDIKPGNIMLIPGSSTIKLTDFGIARITDSSKTKTGMVLGTPSYMSPEQLAGKKVDGRTDLFSLGIMFYQLLCGVLPFKGDSMAALMFKIASESHTDITTIRPELKKKAPCTLPILNKVLEKAPENRYQTGAEFALALRTCLKKIKKS